MFAVACTHMSSSANMSAGADAGVTSRVRLPSLENGLCTLQTQCVAKA